MNLYSITINQTKCLTCFLIVEVKEVVLQVTHDNKEKYTSTFFGKCEDLKPYLHKLDNINHECSKVGNSYTCYELKDI